MNRRNLIPAALLALTALSVSACGSSSDNGDSKQNKADSTPTYSIPTSCDGFMGQVTADSDGKPFELQDTSGSLGSGLKCAWETEDTGSSFSFKVMSDASDLTSTDWTDELTLMGDETYHVEGADLGEWTYGMGELYGGYSMDPQEKKASFTFTKNLGIAEPDDPGETMWATCESDQPLGEDKTMGDLKASEAKYRNSCDALLATLEVE